MHVTPIDHWRDERAEDPTNRLLFDPLARRLLPLAVRMGVSANAVTLTGLLLGSIASAAYWHWSKPACAAAGLLFSLAWLVADSLDGMLARATGTASDFGRELDGLCDHAVFGLIYLALAASIGTGQGWALAICAAAAHAVQANLYEVERLRFHRRSRAEGPARRHVSISPLARLYDAVAARFERLSPLERLIARDGIGSTLQRRYVDAAAAPMKLMIPLSQNMRIIAIYCACALRKPMLFWWFELVPLSVLAAIGAIWLRRIETNLLLDGHDRRPGALSR